MKLLNEIQKNLNCPKNQNNDFGKFKYRSCEDILEAVKPLLCEATLTITDDIVVVGDWHYVKATATICCDGESVTVSAFAREPMVQKGMNESMITGSASSYARKYALNGMFCIDDSKCADANGDNGISIPKPNELQKKVIEAVCSELPEVKGKVVDVKKVMAIFIEKFTTYPKKIETAADAAKFLLDLDRPEIYKKDKRTKFEKAYNIEPDEDSQQEPKELRYYCNGCSQEFYELKNNKCPKCQRKAEQVVDRSAK